MIKKRTNPEKNASKLASKKRSAQEKSNTVVIKKYSNRRLYDVQQSCYLTLDEVVDLIKRGFEVQVVDSKTKEDITKSVLTQIVLEQNGIHLFSASFLHQIIRNKDDIVAEFFTDFVPKLLESFLEVRDTMKRQISTITSPRTWLSATSKDLSQLWRNTIPQASETTSATNKKSEKITLAENDSDMDELISDEPSDSEIREVSEKTRSQQKALEDVLLLKEKIKELESRLDDLKV